MSDRVLPPPQVDMPRLRWWPMVAVLVLAAVTIAAGAVNEAFGEGSRFALGSPERWLALLGFGLCLGTPGSAWPWSSAAWAALAAGAALGLALPHMPVWLWLTSPDIFSHRQLLGPAACLAAGLALLATTPVRPFALPPACLAAGVALSLTAVINDPVAGGSSFAGGTVLLSGTLVFAVARLRRFLPGPWMGIGERIGASWLVTIGLLLSAAHWAPPPAPLVEPSVPAQQPVWAAPDVPGYAPPLRHGEPFVPGVGRQGGLPLGTN